jgi:sigma-B regulation protein RsbU (phosphoserine phosphatase)
LREQNLAHTRRLEDELADARAFQRSLLPVEEAIVEGVPVACRLLPCTQLAGDIFDYAPCGEGRASLLVADVSGHGGSAAMLTGLVKSAFHAALAEGHEPERVATKIVSALRPFGPERFVTMICVCVEPGAGVLDYVNAGHPPGILWTPSAPGRVADPAGKLAPTGPILSPALPGGRWRRRRIDLAPGSRLLLYTDGVIESTSGTALFGDEGLRLAIARRTEGGAALLEEILSGLRTLRAGHPQTDDVTLVTAVPCPEAR